MSERIWRCPNCGAVLKPGRFARSATCEFCHGVVTIDESAVSAQRFREAHRQWCAPRASDSRAWFTLAGEHWTTLALVAHGEIADVFQVERARQPTERGLAKVLRDAADLPMLDLEWNALQVLKASRQKGADALAPRVPDPVARGVIEGGPHSGAHASIHRWVPGFDVTLEAVRAAFPRGVDARVATWMWRRTLEVLGFLHASGIVHGAVLPQHLLVERGEHGLRLVGYGCADRVGRPLAAVVSRYERFYPRPMLDSGTLSPAHDLVMSARCIAFVLGADESGNVPSSVATPLRTLIESVAQGADSDDAWRTHARLGALANDLFGPPSFHPLVMPHDSVRPRTR